MSTMARRFVALFQEWQDQPRSCHGDIAEPSMWAYVRERDEDISAISIWDAKPAGETQPFSRLCDVILFDDGSSALRRYDDLRPTDWQDVPAAA